MTGASDQNAPLLGSSDRGGGRERPLVVAIGGTDTNAMERIASELPVGRGMSFVPVLASTPAPLRLNLALLSRVSQLTVAEVTRPVPLAADHLFVVPQGQRVTCLEDALVPEPQAGGPPLDHFFRSLAQHHGERSAALLLSGLRGDGSLGVAELKAAGALVLLQGPVNAGNDALPDVQLLGKCADLVLPLSRLVGALTDYFRPRRDRADSGSALFAEETLGSILSMLAETTGHDFSRYKRSTVSRRIQRRMRVHGIQDPTHYAELLRSRPAEAELLFNEMLIGVTSFFRDPDSYRALERALDDLLARQPSQHEVRAWVPACSTGEEAYSMAILLHECIHRANKQQTVKLFATDVDAKAIEFARAGRYPAGISAHVGAERLERFFIQEDDTFRINKETRERIIFAPHNVTRDPPFTHLDLITCRNFLIYLEPDLQQQVLGLFEYALDARGLLLLGGSESVGAMQSAFDLIDKRVKLFARRPAPPRRTFGLSFDPIPGPRAPKLEDRALSRDSLRRGPAASAEQLLLSEFVPPTVIISPSGELAFIHGRTGRFLEPPEGEPTTNVFDMAREGLRLELPAAVRAAHHSQQTVVRRGLKVRTNGSIEPVTITVKPLEQPATLRGLLLVTFEIEDDNTSQGPTHSEHAGNLEAELHYVRSTLQGMIEDLESSNEELKSMNEELQSTNEEVQSSNEELSTSREELQSLNEELQTLNEELAQRNALLSQSNDDMHNLLSSVQVATVFVDALLNIKRFTAPARNVFRLRDSDIGRPVSDLVINLDYETLIEDAREVLHTLVFTEREVQTPEGEWRSIRIQPYRTANNVIDGLIITVTDIERLKKAEFATRKSQLLFDGVLASLPAPLALLDESFHIVHVSDEFCRQFGSAAAHLMGQPLDVLGAGWRHPTVGERLEALSRGEASPPLRLRGSLGPPAPLDVVIHLRRLPKHVGSARFLLLTCALSTPAPPAIEVA